VTWWYSERARWVGEGEEALLWVDLGDFVDADQEPRSPEHASADFECLGLVRSSAVADAGDAAESVWPGSGRESLRSGGASSCGRSSSRSGRSPCLTRAPRFQVHPVGRAVVALRIEQSDAEVESLGRDTRIKWKEPDVAGKKRPKSLAQTEKKAPGKAKRPKKTSRGK
jgi:hypothetical protein